MGGGVDLGPVLAGVGDCGGWGTESALVCGGGEGGGEEGVLLHAGGEEECGRFVYGKGRGGEVVGIYGKGVEEV